ncbi:MAG: hypothetical protein BRD55_01265 [Bacteroidetes bacterium SW_9_63_38]|nr:MAG: hypothetical protein BRD55_01265 [Bacteroidetes bacterium SW_9_63_38]
MCFRARTFALVLALLGLGSLSAHAQSAATYDTTTVNGRKAVVIGTSTAGIAHPVQGGDVTWTNDYLWVLDDLVFVDEGQTLRIEPGTVVKGDPGTGADASALVVARGGTIFAEGTARRPIIFTSLKDDLTTTEDRSRYFRGGWGGVIVLGRAPINPEAGVHDVEGIPPNSFRNVYGGNDPHDNSGVLRYVSIRHGGTVLEEDEEINGLTLAGVGRGTTVEYVEVVGNKDDGIEFFGGTVDATHLVTAFVGDDNYDIDQGYSGRGQFWLGVQNRYYADHAGEHDGGEAEYGGEDSRPFSTPQLYNVTYVGSGRNGTGSTALNLRDNFAGAYYNSLFVDFPGALVRVENHLDPEVGDSWARFQEGTLQLRGNLLGRIGGRADGGGPARRLVANTKYGPVGKAAAEQLGLSDAALPRRVSQSLARQNARTTDAPVRTLQRSPRGFLQHLNPRPTSEALRVEEAMPPTDGFFAPVDYVGAFSATDNWARSWSYLGQGGSEYPGLGLFESQARPDAQRRVE